MSLTMYQTSMPIFIRMLNNLSQILHKAEAFAQERNIEPHVLIQSRLAPDMFPLSVQIQIASDAAKNCGARLAGIEVPSFEDKETTFPELQERIKKTIVFLETIKPEQFAESEERKVVIKTRERDLEFVGKNYLLYFALPNFYFHITTAYGILRHNGLDIGKKDYIGGAL